MNKIIGIFLFSLLAAGSASAQSRLYDVYTDRATWVKAVLDAGITPAIGTQTFQSETILVGLYSCPAWGGSLIHLALIALSACRGSTMATKLYGRVLTL